MPDNLNKDREPGSYLVTPEMAAYGAELLRDARIGADPRETVTDIYYGMQAIANLERRVATAAGSIAVQPEADVIK